MIQYIQQRILEKYPEQHIHSVEILDSIFPEEPETIIKTHFILPENYGEIDKAFLHLYIENPTGKMFWGYKLCWCKINERWDKNQKQLFVGETQIEEPGVFLDVTETFMYLTQDDLITSIFGRQSKNPNDTLNSIIRVLYLHIIFKPIQSFKGKCDRWLSC